ncbi:hypothetical protein [Azonexus sp. IMCC34839]|uniref:hypothetical protein n=1 Tax=Azonexus sp. IMCC34839 TaxID=3133695 RepID=UPI00399AF961
MQTVWDIDQGVAMLYVARDKEGRIREMHPAPHGDAQEALPADNAEVLEFINERWRQNEMLQLDLDFIRVIEDLIELLIAKKVILVTDLPPQIQEKLMRRKIARQQITLEESVGMQGDDIIPI